MKKMYVMMEVGMGVDFFRGEFKSVGSGIETDMPEEVERLVEVMCKRLKGDGSCAFTFGNDPSIDLGVGVQYGRLFRMPWSEAEAVFWARDGSLVESRKLGKPNKRVVRKLVMEMIERHNRQMEAEAAREYW